MNPPSTAPTISDLAASLRRRETSASELTVATLRRIAELNPALNAFALVDESGALQAARAADAELASGLDRGPLHGVPVAVKDLIDMAGLPTTCGSASAFGVETATRDAEVVTRLRQAGAVIVGKTTLHEFAYGATGDRSVHGASRNPRDRRRMSGGSSGGSAVAVGSGMVPLSVGTDTAGSVRVPAALCGVVGLKPAFDAISSQGVYPLAPSLDHVGLLAATTADVAVAYTVLSGGIADDEIPDGPISVGWVPPSDIAVTDPRIEAKVHLFLTTSGLDLHIVRGLVPQGDQTLFEISSTLQGLEAFRVHEHHLEHDHETIDPEVLARLRQGGDITASDYARADEARQEFRATVSNLLETHSLLALPTVPVVAPLLGVRNVRVADVDLEVRAALLSLTSPWNLTSGPAISLPAGNVDGLPIAVQLVTAPGRESLLFEVARRLETAKQQVTATC